GNGTSAILEPFSFDYFDTVARRMRTVTISAQRVAMADAPPVPPVPDPVRLGGLRIWGAMAAGVLAGLVAVLAGRSGGAMVRAALGRRWPLLTRDGRALWRAGRQGDLPALRAAAWRIAQTSPSPARARLLDGFDTGVFSARGPAPDPARFARAYLRARPKEGPREPTPSDLLSDARQGGTVELT
ncbi:hypothetical protein LCGC14_3009460, partial [marine sediment metagenome]